MKYKILLFLILLIFIPIATSTTLVNNASTNGWTTSNISLNGSRITGGGFLALNLNASYLLGLEIYYSFDETTGTLIHNVNTESGLINNTNTGTYYGNTTLNSTGGIKGNAGLLDGINDRVNIGNDASINRTQYSISIRFKTVATSPDTSFGQRIVQMERGAGTSRLALMMRSNIPEFVWVNSSTVFMRLSTSTVSNDGVWHNLFGATNGTNFTIYLDGSLKNSTTDSLTPLFNGLYVGDISTGGASFPGSVDELQVWSHANFSASEISVLYTSPFRTKSMSIIDNQTASVGNIINRTRITYIGQDSNNNVSLYARQNGTTAWTLVQSNVSSGIWFPLYPSLQFSSLNSLDFAIELNGNGSDTVFVSSLDWDEATPCSSDVLYNPSLNNIYVYNNGSNPSCIYNMLSNNSILNQTSPGVWILNANLTVNGSSTSFYINSSDTSILRLAKNFEFNGKELFISDILVTSWNLSSNDVIQYPDSRPSFKVDIPTTNININNSNFSYLHAGGVQLLSAQNVIISNSVFTKNYYGIYGSVIGKNGGNVYFENITIIDSEYLGIGLRITNSKNITILGANITNGDRGMFFDANTSNVTITNSILNNITRDDDMYDTGIHLFNVDNFSINNVTCNNIGSTCILLQNRVNNTNITNSTFNGFNIDTKISSTYADDYSEPPTAISIVELYKSFITDGTESHSDNYTKISNYKSNNILISNNIYNNISVMLYTQGTTNLVHDLVKYWEINYSFPNMTDPSHYYISNNFSKVFHAGCPKNRSVVSCSPIQNISRIQYIYGHSTNKHLYFDFELEKNNFSVYPEMFDIISGGGAATNLSVPVDFYLYSPSFTPFFGSSKNNTIFSNGTTYIQMWNDTLEPAGYRTINATIVPSATVYVIVNTYNSTLLNFTATGSGTINVTVNNSDFTVTNGLLYSIKKNNVVQQAVIASGNSVSFTNIAVGSDYEIALGGVSSITIPANSWGMFNNWSSNLTFSQIAANESNDVAYTWYNTTSGDWEDFYIGQTYNQNNVIPYWNSVLGYFNAQTTITTTVITPVNTGLTVGWNMLYVEGGTNRTLSEIQTNIALSCTVNDLYKWNTTTGDYDNAGTSIVQPNEGFIVDVAANCNWVRTTI